MSERMHVPGLLQRGPFIWVCTIGNIRATGIPEVYACFFRLEEFSGSWTDCRQGEHSGGRLAAIAAVLPAAANFGNGVRPAGPVLLRNLETHDVVRVVARALVAVDVLEDIGTYFAILADGSVFTAASCFVVFDDDTFVR